MFPGLFATVLLVAASAWAEDPGQRLAEKGAAGGSAPCSSCHGLAGEGNPAAGFPALAGMDETYLLRQLNLIRSGDRPAPAMAPSITAVTDEEAAEVARYYAALPPAGPAGDPPDEATAKLAETLVRVGDWPGRNLPSCDSCHGRELTGVNGAFPGIAGQSATYLKTQLMAWQGELRKTDPGDLMGSVARKLTDEEIDAVSAWLASQSGGAR